MHACMAFSCPSDQVISASIRYLDCASYPGTDESRVRTSPALDCSSAEWRSGMAVIVLLLLLDCLLLPLLVFRHLVRNRSRIAAKEEEFRAVWGILYEVTALAGRMSPSKARL